MPRSFLITNKRYCTTITKCQQSDGSVTKLPFTSVAFEIDKEPKHNFPVDGVNDGSKLVCVEESNLLESSPKSNLIIEDQLEENKLDNAKVILSLTPPSTPFQNPTNDIHICPDCGKHYSTSSNLTRHRQTHRSVTDKKARKCPHCDKVYVSMPAYSMHVRTHTQGCQCKFCGKCFSRPWLLQGHIRTHTGEKPFKCQICSKAFADKSNLRAHVQTHSMVKPFVCQRCGKAFALKSYLYKHEESSCMRLHRSLSRFKDKQKKICKQMVKSRNAELHHHKMSNKKI